MLAWTAGLWLASHWGGLQTFSFKFHGSNVVCDRASTDTEDVHADEEQCRGKLRIGTDWEKDQETYPFGGTTRIPNILTMKSWRDPRHLQIGLEIPLQAQDDSHDACSKFGGPSMSDLVHRVPCQICCNHSTTQGCKHICCWCGETEQSLLIATLLCLPLRFNLHMTFKSNTMYHGKRLV